METCGRFVFEYYVAYLYWRLVLEMKTLVERSIMERGGSRKREMGRGIE